MTNDVAFDPNPERNTSLKESFSIEVEKHAFDNHNTLLESLVILSDHYGVAEKITTYISRPLKEKLELEAISNRMLKHNVPLATLFD